MSEKPKPLKVFGRSHYACTRCKSSKIKCLGEKPTCANCKAVNKEDSCHYPAIDRKIVIMESALNQLHSKVKHMEELLKAQGPPTASLSPATLSMILNRDTWLDMGTDSYLLPDTENDHIPHKLLVLCAHQLPEQNYAQLLIDAVCHTYSSEFYLIDREAVTALTTIIYNYFLLRDIFNMGPQAAAVPFSPVSLCYYFGLLAFGEQIQNMTREPMFSPKHARISSPQIPGMEYFATASKLFQLNYEQPSILYIQSSVILGFVACNLNRYNTVYTFFGVALRSAVANGYHRQLERPPFLNDEQKAQCRLLEEKTKRLWWTIFVVDIIWAAKMNMPVHIDYTDTDVELPHEGLSVDLRDNFDSEMLEANVQLVKCVAKCNKLIYGPNVRTFSMNYINLEKLNQKYLIKNILTCLDTLRVEFEEPTLNGYKQQNVFLLTDRNLINLFLRYNQLIILVVDPLFSLIFDNSIADNLQYNKAVLQAISKGISAAARTVVIMLQLYKYNRLFVLGFWDSQHLFSASMILTLASIAGYHFPHVSKGFALLRHMAKMNNISAKNNLKKFDIIQQHSSQIPGHLPQINWDCDILENGSPGLNGFLAPIPNVFFNPFMEPDCDIIDPFNLLELEDLETRLLYEHFNFHNTSPQVQQTLSAIARCIQRWDNYSGLPIHISGTARQTALYQHQVSDMN